MQTRTAIRSLLTAAALTGLAALSAPAMAATGNVTPGGAITASGAGAITKGTSTISCNVTFNSTLSTASFTVPPTANVGSVTSASFTPGSILCNSSSAINTPWTIQATSVSYSGTPPTTATSVDLNFVNIGLRNSQIGDCTGTVTGTFNPSTNTITIPAVALTGANPTTACHLHGPGTSDNNNPVVLTVSPSQTVNVTAP